MPWLTFPYSSENHAKLKEHYNLIGIPMVYVLDANTGFLITKKGRKDICDLGVTCMKNWQEEEGHMREKTNHLEWGAKKVEEARIEKERKEKEEEELRKKREEEGEDYDDGKK